jgi:hypothetical protein
MTVIVRRNAASPIRSRVAPRERRASAALCDALQQRRTTNGVGGLSSSRDSSIPSLRRGEADVATRRGSDRGCRIVTSGGAKRRRRIACVFVAVVAR